MNNSIGTIIDLPRGGAVIMVSDCNFVMIRRKKGMFLGQQVCFTDYDIKETNNVKAKLAATIFSIAAVFVIAIAAYLQLVVNSPANNTYAFVGIDINPSMEFLVGKDNLVIGVKPVNDDARSLIKDFKPERKQIGEVIYSIEKIAGQKGYIKPGSNNIMLVSVSLNPDMEMSIDKEFEFEKLIEEIEYAISTLDNSNVEGKLVEVPMGLKKKADKNGITVGRQYIYEKSIEQNINLSLEEIKKEEIANLLEEVKIVYNNSNDELHEIPVPTQTSIMTPLPSPTVTATPVAYTSTPTAVTETKLTPTKKAELLPTAVPQKTQNQTVKQTPITSEVKTDNDYAVISGKAEGGRIVLNWQQPERKKGFQYYKVVASKNNVRPKYPQDGYLYAISDFGTTSAVIDNNQPYNDGDFGAKFSNGQKYYFSITTVYDDAVVPGDVIVLTYPGKSGMENASQTSPSIKVTGEVKDGKVILSWNPVNVKDFNYYKIVISKNNSAPKYPEDGYLFYIEDPSVTKAEIDNSGSYNGGDFGGRIEPGKTYYFSVTLVYGGNKVPGNAVKLTFPD